MINLNIDKSVFNDIYYPLLFDYSNRYEVYYGGAGSGKSVFVCQKLILKACKSKRKILVIRKYGTTLKDSVVQLFIDTLKKWKLYEYCDFNKSTYTITMPNESMILFKGLDDSEKIKSITDITDIWGEEVTEITEEDWTQLDLRLRADSGNLQFICSFNPVSKANYVYKKWFAEESKFQNTMILHTTYKHNRFLPIEYIKALEEKEKTNPVYYRIYALGEFCSLDKLIYSNWEIDEFEYKDITGTKCIGLDFGYSNDPNALICAIVTDDKKLYVYKEWTDTNKTNDEIASVIKTMGLSKDVIIADSAEPKSCEELRRFGLRIKESLKGPDSVNHGIKLIQEYKMIIHPSCSSTIEELQNYAWQKDKKTGEYIDKPIDMFNHLLDALRYSMQLLGKGKIRTLDKSKLGL